MNGTIEQQIRSSFNFSRRSITAQASRRLTPHVSVSSAYQLQHTHLLDNRTDSANQPLIDRVFTEVRLSSFSTQGFYDTRDEPVDATRGEYLSANAQIAARRIGSEVGFAKSFFTAQLFRPLPYGRGSVFAAQARLGVATGFPRDVVQTVDGQPVVVGGVRDLPEPERFFAGGDTTVRGFARDRLGAECNGDPLGGEGLFILNEELRFPIHSVIGGVLFYDGGNVYRTLDDYDILELRHVAGAGLRLQTPIGPFRVEYGAILNRKPGEDRGQFFFSIGQAF